MVVRPSHSIDAEGCAPRSDGELVLLSPVLVLAPAM